MMPRLASAVVAVLALASKVAMAKTSTAATIINLPKSSLLASSVTRGTSRILSIPRGGSSSTTSSTSKKASKKKMTKKTKKNTKKAQKVVESALKEKDSAAALGDAIRDRADILRDEDPLLASIDWSIGSLGHALGASDERMMRGDGGGVQASPASVVANYFLKSHGGAHALQCACSMLATLSGLGAILFQKRPGDLGCTLLQRTMLFAMIKHVSGLLVAASLAAKAIPKIGLGQARVWMEKLVLDPVSQYVFYTSLVLLWLPSRQRWLSRWWASVGIVPTLLVGPILLREMISTMLVVSDVLVLWSSSSSSSSGGGSSGDSSFLPTILKLSQSTINAGMSLLTTPGVWRPADPAQRQAILAKLVAKASLTFEVLVGLLFAMDFVISFVEFAFRRMAYRPSLTETLKRLLCVRLYVHFLWVRRQPIQALAIKLRGGAAQLPFWILDTALHPATAMGIILPQQDDFATFQWNDYAAMALALDKE